MSLRARDLIKSEPMTVGPDAPLLEVLHLFVEAHVGSVPVVDPSGTVRGIITRSDLLRVVDQAYDDDVDPAEPAADAAALETLTAIDVATPEPVWIAPDASAADVAQVMRERGVHRVLVGRDGTLAGVLSAFDLLEALR